MVYPAEDGTPTGRELLSTYDRAIRMLRLFDDWRLSEFSYDSAGNRLSHTQPNGVVTTSSFDAGNRVTSIETVDSSSNTIYSLTYTYDLAGIVGVASRLRTSLPAWVMVLAPPTPVAARGYRPEVPTRPSSAA